MAIESPAIRNLWLQWDQLVLGVKGSCTESGTAQEDTTTSLVNCAWVTSRYCVKVDALWSDCRLLGVKKTISKVKKGFYWYRMKESTRKMFLLTKTKQP